MARMRQGWTVNELIVVGTIVSLVLLVIAWNHRADVRVQRVVTAESQVVEFKKAMQIYYLDTGSFPAASEGLDVLVESPGLAQWRGPYLHADRLPRDPWGREYVYTRSDSRGGRCSILSAGPDGRHGTGDDIGITIRKPAESGGHPGIRMASAFPGRTNENVMNYGGKEA